MRADPIVLGRFHRQGWSLGDSKGGPHPPLACFLCGVTAFRVETGALRSVAAQAHRLRIHFPVSPSQIRNTVSDLKGRMKKRTWSFRLQPETKCSAFILTWERNGVTNLTCDVPLISRLRRQLPPEGEALGGCVTHPSPRGATQRSGRDATMKNGEADTELPPLRGESAVERARSDVGYHIFG